MIWSVVLIAGMLVAAAPASAEVQFDSQLGLRGGSFINPSGTAVDSLGNVWIADTGNNRIQKFDSAGSHILSVGSSTGQSGTAEYRFSGPEGVATDSANNVYVADTFNRRIQKYDSTGVFIAAWGFGVDDGTSTYQVCASGCQAGLSGAGDGQFASPEGVAVNGTSAYVADTSNRRIEQFNATTGGFVRMWGWGVDDGTFAFQNCTSGCQGGYSGSGDGQFASPRGVAADTSHVYVADTFNYRIQKFNVSGSPVTFNTKWGAFGTAENQFNLPEGVATDGSGKVYVADTNNTRIQKFDATGVPTFERMWGWGVDDGNSVFQTCFSACQGGIGGTGNGQFASFGGPDGIAVGASGVYVGDTGNDRVQRFDSAGNFVTKWGVQSGTGDGEFNGPVGVATDSAGNLYVADQNNVRIEKFDSAGNYETQFGQSELALPGQLATDPSGNVLVVDNTNERIVKYSSSGVFERTWGWGVNTGANQFEICTTLPCQPGYSGSGEGQFNIPDGIATDSSGNVYVTDYSDRIQKFSSTGSFVTQWGAFGSGQVQFFTPRGLDVDASGRIYIADQGNSRIQVISPTGSFVREWGTGGTGDGEFQDPWDVAIDATGHVYVVDLNNNRIQKFTADGDYILQWGTLGNDEGQFDSPEAVDVDSSYNVYVSDFWNNRVQKFSQTFNNSFSGSVGGGGTASTNATAAGDDPVGTSVTTPNAGTVTIGEVTPPTQSPPSTYTFFGWEVDVSAPAASASSPLTLVFRLDDLLLPSGVDHTNVDVFRNGTLVPACSGAPGEASPDPCVSSRASLPGNDAEVTVRSSTASDWNFGGSDTGDIVVVKDAVPDHDTNFPFTAGGGLSPTNFTLDDDTDGMLSNTQTFANVPSGSGYSITENPPVTWEQQSATCDDGSPPSNISLQAFETVTCTFTNNQLGYARPKSGTPVTAKLVPAYYSCFGGDHTHGGPLALPSCNPPIQTSGYLTFNAPDRAAPYNTAANATGTIVLKVTCLTPGTTTETGQGPACPAAGDQEDVKITTTLSDVRCVDATGGCSVAGGHYSGKVLGAVSLQITDRLNGPAETSPGTIEGYTSLNWGIQCATGACSAVTSADIITPGLVREVKRTIWELREINVFDGGADGDFAAAPPPASGVCPPACVIDETDSQFLTQGLNIP